MLAPIIFVACDVPHQKQAESLLEKLNPTLCGIKIGKELFTEAGPRFVEKVVSKGYRVFLDLKFHDIPNTVAGACRAAARLGVFMINVHASGGMAMMQAAKEALVAFQSPPRLVAVTVLTSLSETDLQQMGFQESVEKTVLNFAILSKKASLDGVVCSSQEVSLLRRNIPKPFLLVTPGIRPSNAEADDQKRVMTPEAAMAAGSDYLVVGRPITQAADPVAVLQSMVDSLAFSTV